MILRVIGIALLSAICAFLLRGLASRAAPIYASLAAIVVLALCKDGVDGVISSVLGVASSINISEPVSVILKIIGLGYLFGISADICRELGEGGIAKALEVAGRVEIFSLSVPYLVKTLNLGIGFLAG